MDKNSSESVSLSQAETGLCWELKNYLTLISKQVEFSYTNPAEKMLKDIEKTAVEALGIIDNFLLYARTEYGQEMLPIEPLGAGSILYDVASQLTDDINKDGPKVAISNNYQEPIMGNRTALRTSMVCMAQLIIHSNKKVSELRLVANSKKNGEIYMGVFGDTFKVKANELTTAKRLLGKSPMTLSNQTHKSGVDLTIADGLAQSMGSSLEVYKFNKMYGLGLKLHKSDQLSLV